jgi:hypothetical protein
LEEAEAKNCREEENKTFNEWKRKEKSNYHFSPSLSIITVQFIGRVVGTHDQKKKSLLKSIIYNLFFSSRLNKTT